MKCFCFGRLGTALPLQHFLSKTSSPDVSTPKIDCFISLGSLKTVVDLLVSGA